MSTRERRIYKSLNEKEYEYARWKIKPKVA